jgi:subtilase family serine protease/Tol biopolymer transport system component/flagellar hook assembly protein FlgD
MAPLGGGSFLRVGRVACLAAATLALPRGSEAGDPIAAARRLRERAGSLAPLPDAATGITRDVGPIAVIEHDGTDYSRLEPDGTPNYAARARVTQRFYQEHGDLYDFVVVFTNFEFDTAGAVGFHNLVRNDVSGIGLPPVNNGPLFGSPGRLKGYVDMGFVGQYRLPPFSTQPGAPGFGAAVDVLSHEIGHQWLTGIRYRTPAGADSTDLQGLDQTHWSYLLDSDASLFYGSDWAAQGTGVFRAARVRQLYSSLDLYLMGLLDPLRVAPFTLLRNPAVSPYQLPQEGATVSAVTETIDIAQVVAAESPRQPDHRTSQKDFRVGFVFLASPGADPTAEDLEAVNRLREAFSARFFALTRGVAFADTTLAEEPLPPPGTAADLDLALAWLRTKQALDGRWEDSAGTGVRDTAAVLDALDAAAETAGAYAYGQAWLAGTNPANLDFVARRARGRALDTLTPAARGELIAAIFGHRNADGGFGTAQGYESDGFDTALALSALHDLAAPADGRVRGALIALAGLQAPEGGWALVPGRGASTMATAQVLLALHDWSELPEAAALLTPAIAALTSRQNADGGFGESPSTAHGTALALLALDRAAAPASVVEPATAWLQRTQLAEGSWNGRAYETALAIAALKGRTAPNLVVRQDDLTLDPAQPEEGAVVHASARVRNLGRLASPPTVVRLYDGAPNASNAVDEAPLAAIEPGQDALVTLDLDTTGRPGTHLLSVRADADDVVAEVREDDNTASRSLEVEGPMADLAIRVSDIVVAPYPPEAGETVQVTVAVTNSGDRDAPSTELRLFRGHPGEGGLAIGQASLPPLSAGSSIAATFVWLASGPPASTHLVAVADAAFSVAESDESNNQAALPVAITGPIGPGPDLEIPLVEVEPSVLTQVPQTFSVRIVVRNLGRDPAASTVALFDGVPGSGLLVAEQPVALAPRSGTVLVIPFEVTTPGSRTLTAVADRAALVEETNEDNNQASAAVTDPGNTLDVAVTGVAPSSTDLTIGETLTVTVTVRNRGTLPIAQVPVILAHAAGALAELDRELVTLAPGASASVPLAWTTSFTGDAVPLAVVADPFDVLVEADEANNRRDFTVQVRPSALPNLRITGADITFEPDPPLEGGSAIVRARVANPGSADAGPFAVRFFLGDPGAAGILLGEAALPGVDGQSSVVASIPWSPVDARGTLGMFVVVDAAEQVEEYDETDNVGFRPFQVVGLPDLTLSSADLTLTPAFPRAGENVTVRAVVRNLGSRPTAACTLRVFEGEPGGGALVEEAPIPALEPGQPASISLAWTPASTGELLLSALADADDVVAEADEGNNLARRSVVVQDADLYTTAPFFSPDGDGIQDQTTLAYRATGPVAILVSDSRGGLVRTLAEDAPAEGSVSWDGRDDRGRLLWDGTYSLTLRTHSGTILGRLEVVLDTNRSPIHDAAGTGLVALRTLDAAQTNARGPAWLPSEDEVLLIIPIENPLAGFTRGLLRWRLDGTRSYVSADPWYDAVVQFASLDPVAPDGREVLVTKGGAIVAVDLTSGARRTVAPGLSARWSPDGGRILVGNVVFDRDGTPLATLPFGNGQWSPDGQALIDGLDIVRRDGTDPRQVPLPIEVEPEGMLGAPCFGGTFWRGDGRIVLRIGRWTAHEQEATTIACDPDRLFIHDLATAQSREALPLRGVGFGDQWSPDGSRLLHPARTGDSQEVTRETEGPGLQIWPTHVWATPRSSAAFFCEAGPEACQPYVARLAAITNLLNLTADLTAVPLPASNGILVRGTVTDAHLDRWQVDFASSASPTTWHPIGPSWSAPVVDGLLATWVPSQPGTYLIRLMAWDRAGGHRTVSRVVAWSQTPSLANITQSERLISPNDDGVKDVVRFDFLVQEPTRLEARVNGPAPPEGTPGQPPDVRRYSVDLPAIGPGALVWDGRDASGQLVADGRYTVFLNEVPFPVDVDATPPEIAIRHENLRPLGTEMVESPGEVQGPAGQCVSAQVEVAVPGLDRYWHVVDANLKGWRHGMESGAQQIYEPERDASGQIVYVGGVPKVLRVNGRPVDRHRLVADPNWPGTLEAEDVGGNVSSLASAPVPTELFVVGLRPMPRCLPPGASIPRNRQLTDGPVRLTPRTRFFVKGAPGSVSGARFEYRESEAAPWSPGPASGVVNDGIVDVDLLALGLLPGRSYHGRFVGAGSQAAVSDEFLFALCTESVNLRLDEPEPIPGTSQSRYVVSLEADVSQPLSAVDLAVTGSGALQGFGLQVPFERTGPTTYRKVVVAPSAGCSLEGEQRVLEFAALVRDANGAPLAHDASCLDLRRQIGRCAHHLAITEERLECSAASPDRVVLKVQAQSPDPTALVTVSRSGDGAPVGEPFVLGTGHVCGSTPSPSGVVPLYCDDRLLVADVAGVPEGTARFTGRLEAQPPAASPLATAEREVRIDRTAPVLTMTEPPEGGAACVERNGLVENVRLVLRVDDDVPSVAVTRLAYRYGDGPWHPMCLDQDCQPWDDLPTGTALEKRWDVRGLVDGRYELRFEICDRSGNRTAFTRSVSITRGGTAIDLLSVANPDFSPNGDGHADETRVTFRLPQTLRVEVDVHAGTPSGAVVRRLADQQLSAGAHAFVWDGRTDAGAPAADGRYFVVAKGTNSCGGTSATPASVQLDTAPPSAEISSPLPGALVLTNTDVLGRATDLRFESYALEFGPGVAPAAWTSIAAGTSPVGAGGLPGLLGVFQPPATEGIYTLRLLARDRALNETETRSLVTVGPRAFLERFTLSPGVFSPNGDGRLDTAAIEYELILAGRVTLEVQDSGGGLLRRLESAVDHVPGTYDLLWDGRLASGAPAPEGSHRVVIHVEDPGGAVPAQEQALSLVLDVSPPAASIAHPVVGAFVGPDQFVHGSVADARLREYVISAERPFSANVELARGNQSQVDADLAALAALTDGPYQLVVTAEDAGENRTLVRVPFGLDGVLPQALIQFPLPGSVVERGSAPVAVTGTALDAHLERYELGFGPGASPSYFVPIASSTQSVTGGTLGSWLVAGLADGQYTLKLAVRDLADHIAESRAAVVLDGHAPDAAIEAPSADAHINASPLVTGTAADPNLASWRLDAAPGEASTAFQWSMLSEGIAPVVGGTLAQWAPLPPDGRHTLRLTVADQAGHVTTLLRTVTVDTTAPGAPSNVASLVQRDGPTADVTLTWTANSESDLAGYALTRNGLVVTPTPLTAPTFTDQDLPEGQYEYRLTAVDRAGNASPPTSHLVQLDLTPPAIALLQPVTGARVSGSIDVRGTAFSLDDFAEFRLIAGEGDPPSAWTLIHRSTMPVSVGFLGTWTPAQAGPHVLALEAEDQSGNQARVAVSVFVDHTPPAVPVLVSVVNAPQPDTLTATWQPGSEPDLIGYLVYRNGRLANAPGLVIGDLRPYVVPGPAYADAMLPDGSHCYRVVAMDEAGNLSPPSNEICRTLDNRPPHAVLVEPPDGTRFDFPLRLVAVTPDLDVASVRFDVTPAAQSSWTPIGPPDTQPPYEATLDPQALTPGSYRVRAVAVESGGEEDPSPSPITVIYGDSTAPAAPAGLAAAVEGDVVSLAWTAGPEPDLAGFHVYRDGERLTAAPQAETTFAEVRPLGAYEYAVTSVDADGNESLPSSVEALVYRLMLDPVVPPVTNGPVTLTGRGGQSSNGTVEIIRAGAPVAQAPTGASGTFSVGGITLVAGPNLLAARERGAPGQASVLSDDVVAIANAAPGPVTGLEAHVSGLQVTLDWNAGSEPDLFGYHVRRDGVDRTVPVPVTTASQISASSHVGGFNPYAAFDGDPESAWIPELTQEPSHWTIELLQPTLVGRVDLLFRGSSGPVPAPAHRIEAEWEGRFLPLLDAPASVQSQVSHALALPFATTKLRVTLAAASYVGLAEVSILRLDVVPAGTHAYTETAPDGVHAYEVAAVDRYGARGPSSGVSLEVGDIEPPPVPTDLQAGVNGSDVSLAWQPVIAPDLAGYAVLRDGARIGESATPAYLDASRPNGTYSYSVRSRDAVGNESADSAPASATVSVGAPPVPVLAATTPPAGGVLLSWTHPGAAGFLLQRATVAGGPYEPIASTGDVREHADHDVRPGAAYFYTVRALDAVGNASGASNEVAVTPAAPTPVMLRPSDASHPITLRATAAGFGGRAWPDAVVALTVNGELRGIADAGRAYDEVESRAVPGDEFGARISPDGRTIAFSVMDGGVAQTRWVEWASGTVSQAGSAGSPGAFSPDGRQLTYMARVCDASACQADLRSIDLDSSQVTSLEEGPLDVLESAWSPAGDRVAIVGWDAAASSYRLAVITLATGSATTLAENTDGLGGLRWSSSGEEIAVLRWDPVDHRVEVDVVPAAGGTAQTADDAVGWSVPVWMPTGRTLVYTSALGERPRVRSWNLGTGAITDLTSGTSSTVDPRIDAAGQRLSYLRFDDGFPVALALVVRDLDAGGEREVLSWTGDYASPVELHEWVRGGYLAFQLDGRIRLFPSFDGAFHVPPVALTPGVNLVEAEGIEVSTGAVSDASEPASVTVPAEVFPDLAVAAADLASYPTVPLAGQATVVSARVRNLGHVPVSGAWVNLSLQGPDGLLVNQTASLGAVAPGGSTLVSSYWTPPGPGTYLLRAEADPGQQIAESREDNNEADSGIFVVEAGLLSVQIEADRSSYPANTAVLLTLEVTNGGAPFAGTLRTRVLTAGGDVLTLVDVRPLSVAYGQTQRIDVTWNTGTTLAGAYRFELQALEGDAVRAQANRAFDIEPDVLVWTRVTPQDPTVVLGAGAVVDVRVENRGANTVLSDATVHLEIAHEAGGVPAFIASAGLPSLDPGEGWDGAFVWAPATPAGAFVARAEVSGASGAVLASGFAPLEVHAPSGPALRGTLTLSPSHVLAGAVSHATATVTNDGTIALVGHPFALEATRAGDPAVVLSVPFSLDIPAGETRQALIDVPTSELGAGTYLVFLRSIGSAASLDREALLVHSVITPPSIDSPPPGASVSTPHPTLSVNNGLAAGGAALRYEFQLFRDEALTLPLPGAAGVPETPGVTSWTVQVTLAENERCFWRARATDGFSNSAWTAVASFRVDAVNEPPTAPTPDTPEPGARVATLQPALIVANAFDPELDPLTYDFRLATDAGMTQVVASVAGLLEGPVRTAWPVPLALVENTRYYWSARAQDPNGSSAWTSPIAFLVDVDNESPSATPLLRPDEDGEVATQTPELAVGEASDPEGDALVYRIEVDRVPTFDSPQKQVSPGLFPTAGEAAWTPPLPLADNAHAYWRGSAYDGHTAGPWSFRRFFVNLANDPPEAPVPLDPGAGTIVTTQTPVLRVQNAIDLDLDVLAYSFEVRDASGAVVASASGVPQSLGQTSWLVAEPLAENGEFTWRARAHDGEADGAWSVEIPFRVNSTNDPPTAPSPIAPPEGAVVTIPRPELVVANAISPDLLPLSYTFEVYRLDSGGGSTLVAFAVGVPSGATHTSWVLDQDLPDASYSWRVRAADVNQPGPWMPSARFTVAVDTAPEAPTGLVAVAGDARVDLAWNPSPEPDVTGYRVYRGETAGGPYALVAAPATAAHADTGLPNGQTFYYVVTALDAMFESDPSPEVAATPMTAPLAAEVVFWPAVLEGECLVCAPPPSWNPRPGAQGAQSVTPVLECVRDDGPTGLTAFFGFDNPNAAPIPLPIGTQNFFDPPPADRGQPSLFARGRSPEYPGAFLVPLEAGPLSWWLDGHSVTVDPSRVVKNCPIPPIACVEWLYATIEPPEGYDPTAIDPASVRLAGVVAADPSYQALVDRDGDGWMEREVRFAQSEVRPLLAPGNVSLTVGGALGTQTFAGASVLRVADPKARLQASPTVLSQSQPGSQLLTWLSLRGCFAGAGIDVSSIRLNGVVPVAEVLGIEGGVLKLAFDQSAVVAVLPSGDRVELVLTGTAQGQSFRAVDLVRVIVQGASSP